MDSRVKDMLDAQDKRIAALETKVAGLDVGPMPDVLAMRAAARARGMRVEEIRSVEAAVRAVEGVRR